MDNNYGGMTVNERLWVSGLMEQFDSAVREKNADKIIKILKKVELTEPNITDILRQKGLIE
ncbi:hypothetical protein [Mucilaginibacter sp.]|uniref:hypothetical protein n=1 Tax=Mucilaginibacter sp. TaxID=1882438 RepID=UPI0025F3CF9C|nr:hypothetical protein [Mucilaginibacter sp.]